MATRGAGQNRFVADRVRAASPIASLKDGPRVEELRRNGVDVLALRGAPVLPMPHHIQEAAAGATREAATYPPILGLPSLRRAIAEMVAREEGQSVDPYDEVLITNGGMQAAFTVFTTLLNPGDELILPVPAFFFDEMVRLVGGTPVLVPMDEEEGYRLDVERIERAVSSRTKAILLNTPQNPTGYVATLEDLHALGRVAERRDLLVISDESYRRFVYDGLVHRSMITVPGLNERTIVLRSFTKSFALAAWRIGYIVASPPLIAAFTKAQQWMTISVNHVSQKVAEAAITGPQDWLAGLNPQYQHNRDYVCDAIDEIPGVWCVKPQGSPLLWLNISALGISGLEFSEELLTRYGIGSTAGEYFNAATPHVRITFGGSQETLNKFIDRLGRAAAKHLDQQPLLAGL